jgi:hypothetical protein
MQVNARSLVDEDRTENGLDESETGDTVHELHFPSREPTSHAIDKQL